MIRIPRLRWPLLAVTAAVLAAPACGQGQSAVHARGEWQLVAEALTPFIEAQMAQHRLPGLSIALVHNQEIVWARGFGVVDPRARRRVPATAETPYRVASVSKLFTDIAVMQLVESGQLDLDAPLERYTPDAMPENPFGVPVTLRQVLSHRAGVVREPPVGHYFDPDSPSLAATARSLGATRLVLRPGTATKYSNAAISLAGYAVERTAGVPFAEYMRTHVLEPMGMRGSFAPDAALLARRARGTMWTVDGRRFPAPEFPLGTMPAGELTASMLDLGHFLAMIFAGGRGQDERVLRRETLESMWNVESGFGLGFAVSRLEGHRRIGHNGWHYGFGTELAALPDDRLGVAVSTTSDAANAIARRIADEALRMMLAVRNGAALPAPRVTTPIAADRMRVLAGRWRAGERGVDLWVRDSTLWMWSMTGGFPAPLRAIGDTLVADGTLRWGDRLVPVNGALVFGRDTLRRAGDAAMPSDPPAEWRGLIGEYGWPHDVLYIHERDGRLYALIEWFGLYPLTTTPDGLVFRFPDDGLYAGEEVRFFARRSREAPHADSVSIAGVVFRRRDVFPEDGGIFRIVPMAPIPGLRTAARQAAPPPQPAGLRAPDLVELVSLDSTIRLDIRYATSDNFMGVPLYESARAFMQRPAADALLRAHQALGRAGYGLLIHDAYRPWYVTKMFWDATPDSQHTFVANPARGSKHNRGAAVDLTMYERATGRPVQMVGVYDEFTPRSYPDYPGGTSRQRWLRALLRRAMEAEGFTVDGGEWWHFDYRDWARYPVMNRAFEDLR